MNGVNITDRIDSHVPKSSLEDFSGAVIDVVDKIKDEEVEAKEEAQIEDKEQPQEQESSEDKIEEPLEDASIESESVESEQAEDETIEMQQQEDGVNEALIEETSDANEPEIAEVEQDDQSKAIEGEDSGADEDVILQSQQQEAADLKKGIVNAKSDIREKKLSDASKLPEKKLSLNQFGDILQKQNFYGLSAEMLGQAEVQKSIKQKNQQLYKDWQRKIDSEIEQQEKTDLQIEEKEAEEEKAAGGQKVTEETDEWQIKSTSDTIQDASTKEQENTESEDSKEHLTDQKIEKEDEPIGELQLLDSHDDEDPSIETSEGDSGVENMSTIDGNEQEHEGDSKDKAEVSGENSSDIVSDEDVEHEVLELDEAIMEGEVAVLESDGLSEDPGDETEHPEEGVISEEDASGEGENLDQIDADLDHDEEDAEDLDGIDFVPEESDEETHLEGEEEIVEDRDQEGIEAIEQDDDLDEGQLEDTVQNIENEEEGGNENMEDAEVSEVDGEGENQIMTEEDSEEVETLEDDSEKGPDSVDMQEGEEVSNEEKGENLSVEQENVIQTEGGQKDFIENTEQDESDEKEQSNVVNTIEVNVIEEMLKNLKERRVEVVCRTEILQILHPRESRKDTVDVGEPIMSEHHSEHVGGDFLSERILKLVHELKLFAIKGDYLAFEEILENLDPMTRHMVMRHLRYWSIVGSSTQSLDWIFCQAYFHDEKIPLAIIYKAVIAYMSHVHGIQVILPPLSESDQEILLTRSEAYQFFHDMVDRILLMHARKQKSNNLDSEVVLVS